MLLGLTLGEIRVHDLVGLGFGCVVVVVHCAA